MRQEFRILVSVTVSITVYTNNLYDRLSVLPSSGSSEKGPSLWGSDTLFSKKAKVFFGA
jgi:hypothetical protein